jgi:hypothetical protein
MNLNSAELFDLAYAGDPVMFAESIGITPDDWQAKVLQSSADRLLMLAGRQCGKSCAAALLALHTALFEPGSLVALVSPSQRQSGELFRSHCMAYYRKIPNPVPLTSLTQLSAEFANGSRIVSLPADPDTIRGLSNVAMIIIDEAARTGDDLFAAVTPMLSVSHGRLITLTTPAGKRGWLYKAWMSSDQGWEKHKTTAYDCPRTTKAFLDNERKSMGEVFFGQEYLVEFTANVHAEFTWQEIQDALTEDVEPLFRLLGSASEPRSTNRTDASPRTLISAVDFGTMQDHSALIVCEVTEDQVYKVRWIQQWPIGINYVDVEEDLCRLWRRPPLAGTTLALDVTGVGVPAWHHLQRMGIDAKLIPYWTTGQGYQQGRSHGMITLPKVSMIAAAKAAFGHRKVKISKKLPLHEKLVLELETFERKVSEDTGHESFGSDAPAHDDMVFGLCLSIYTGTRRRIHDPLRILPLRRRQATRNRCFLVSGLAEADTLDLDPDLKSIVITFTDFPDLSKGKIIARHRINCADIAPSEVVDSWSQEQQDNVFSSQQSKSLWTFLTDGPNQGWHSLVVIDEGGRDRRALSLAMALADSMGFPRSTIYVSGEKDIDTSVAAPNHHIYATAKRGRNLIAM